MTSGDGWGVLRDDDPGGSIACQGATTDLSYHGAASAEWIVEAYTHGPADELVTLADFGTVTFTNLTTSPAFFTLTGNDADYIAKNHRAISTPSAPTPTGFTVNYTGRQQTTAAASPGPDSPLTTGLRRGANADVDSRPTPGGPASLRPARRPPPQGDARGGTAGCAWPSRAEGAPGRGGAPR
jgi:hypothetical protein